MSTILKSHLKQILNAKGYYPTEEKLKEMNISKHKFSRILNNESLPSLEEALILSKWLEIKIEDFIKPAN